MRYDRLSIKSDIVTRDLTLGSLRDGDIITITFIGLAVRLSLLSTG
jgi:hypothetical protein